MANEDEQGVHEVDQGVREDEQGVREVDQALMTAIRAAAEVAFEIMPVAGAVSGEELKTIRGRLDEVAGAARAARAGDSEIDFEAALATLYGRCAALAIAAGEPETARKWLDEAERRATDEEARAALAAGRDQPERFRALAHGRALFARANERAAQAASGGLLQRSALGLSRRDERDARKIWRQLARGASDPIAKAAAAELAAPRPLNGQMPSLWSYNGFGLRFAGHRDEWPDGTYATTQCVTALFIPLVPIAAYRVAADGDEGWLVIARERLSGFARAMRYALAGAIAVVIAGLALHGHLTDPERLARQRFDRALEAASTRAPEAAIRALDAALAGPDLHQAGRARARRAGAELVRLTAGMAPRPFRSEHADHAHRLVQRYKLLPREAQGGAALDAAVDAIEGWIQELGAGEGTAAARLALLRLGADVADAKRSGPLLTQLAAARLEVADARAADAPLDALALLVEQPSTEAIARATKLVARLVESPSTLVEAGADLDRWLAATSADDPLRKAVTAQRELALAGRKEAEAEDATPAQLAAMVKQRPWDQYAQLRLARAEIDAGQLDAAAARLDRLGPHGLLVREARLVLAQLLSATGKLAQADALLAGLIAGRIERFVAASGALQQATDRAVTRVQADLRIGNVPYEMQQRYQAAISDEARDAIVREWGQAQIAQDPAVQQAREAYLALADLVPVSLAAGTVKLRRAQGLAGAARDAMLVEAERTFLAIRTEAEGQPEFRLGLGEIYARLGKAKESEAELAAVLAMNDPALSLRVATVYRNLGSVGRAREVAAAVHDRRPPKELAHQAAMLLALLEPDEAAAEAWYRKANQADLQVRASLLELEARRLLRQGKLAECGAKLTAAARLYLEGAHPNYNNAAIAHRQRYACSGDLAALADAEAALAQAHREAPEHPIIIGNLLGMLDGNSQIRVLRKRLDVQAARIDGDAAATIIAALIEGPERDAILAELAADRGAQRAAELLAQYEVLAPNSPAAYRQGFRKAHLRRDEAAARAIVERARRAKQLDASEAARRREEHASGATDAEAIEVLTSSLQHHAASLARRPAGKSRAAILYLDAAQQLSLGLLKAERARLARGREQALEAMKLWPALDATWIVTTSLIDEAGLAADAAAWAKLRRERSPSAALAKLAAEGAPLAAAIRASGPWAEIAGHQRADRSRPGLSDLRLARLLGDAELEARARAVLDDKLARASLELDAVLDPGDPAAAEDLAYLDRR